MVTVTMREVSGGGLDSIDELLSRVGVAMDATLPLGSREWLAVEPEVLDERGPNAVTTTTGAPCVFF